MQNNHFFILLYSLMYSLALSGLFTIGSNSYYKALILHFIICFFVIAQSWKKVGDSFPKAYSLKGFSKDIVKNNFAGFEIQAIDDQDQSIKNFVSTSIKEISSIRSVIRSLVIFIICYGVIRIVVMGDNPPGLFSQFSVSIVASSITLLYSFNFWGMFLFGCFYCLSLYCFGVSLTSPLTYLTSTIFFFLFFFNLGFLNSWYWAKLAKESFAHSFSEMVKRVLPPFLIFCMTFFIADEYIGTEKPLREKLVQNISQKIIPQNFPKKLIPRARQEKTEEIKKALQKISSPSMQKDINHWDEVLAMMARLDQKRKLSSDDINKFKDLSMQEQRMHEQLLQKLRSEIANPAQFHPEDLKDIKSVLRKYGDEEFSFSEISQQHENSFKNFLQNEGKFVQQALDQKLESPHTNQAPWKSFDMDNLHRMVEAREKNIVNQRFGISPSKLLDASGQQKLWEKQKELTQLLSQDDFNAFIKHNKKASRSIKNPLARKIRQNSLVELEKNSRQMPPLPTHMENAFFEHIQYRSELLNSNLDKNAPTYLPPTKNQSSKQRLLNLKALAKSIAAQEKNILPSKNRDALQTKKIRREIWEKQNKIIKELAPSDLDDFMQVNREGLEKIKDPYLRSVRENSLKNISERRPRSQMARDKAAEEERLNQAIKPALKQKKWEKQVGQFLLILILFAFIFFILRIFAKEKIKRDKFELTPEQRVNLDQVLSQLPRSFKDFKEEVDIKYKVYHGAIQELFYPNQKAPPALIIAEQWQEVSYSSLRELDSAMGGVFNKVHFGKQDKFHKKEVREFRKNFDRFKKIISSL